MDLYISNLGSQITDESLRAVFATHGEVSSAFVLKNLADGTSRGSAYVTMPHNDEAVKAISRIDGQVLNGRMVGVMEAQHGKDPSSSFQPGQYPDTRF